MIMIALMLGVPLTDLDHFRRWSDSFIEMSEDKLPQSYDEADMNSKIADIIEFREYFTEQLKDRVANPRDDLLTMLTQAEWEGKPLELEEQLSMAQILLIAGNETTRGLLAGAGKALAEHPDQRAILARVTRADARRGRGVPALRHARHAHVPHRARRRRAPRAADQAGRLLCLLYASANRDEDAWEHGDELDVRRDADPPQIAFGFAEHFCLGASLARREARIVLTELLARFPNYELVGDTDSRPPAHDAGDQDDAGGLPPLTLSARSRAIGVSPKCGRGTSYATTPLTLRSMTVSQSRPSISVRIWSPCSLKSGDLPGFDGVSSNCTGVSTSLYG